MSVKSLEATEFNGPHLKLYLEDLNHHYRWSVRDIKKRMLYQIYYGPDQAQLTESGGNVEATVDYPDELGEIGLPVPIDMMRQADGAAGSGNSSSTHFELMGTQYKLWDLTITQKNAPPTIFVLLRQPSGWDIHVDAPNGARVAQFRKNHGETKLGHLKFIINLEPQVIQALVFSLTFAISTANARFFRVLGIPPSTEYDRLDKYGNLDNLKQPPPHSSPSPSSSLDGFHVSSGNPLARLNLFPSRRRIPLTSNSSSEGGF